MFNKHKQKKRFKELLKKRSKRSYNTKLSGKELNDVLLETKRMKQLIKHKYNLNKEELYELFGQKYPDRNFYENIPENTGNVKYYDEIDVKNIVFKVINEINDLKNIEIKKIIDKNL